MKLRIHEIVKQKTYYDMACNTSIYSVANTIKKLHIQYPLSFVYQQNLNHDKQDIIDENFHQYYLPLVKDIDNTVLIKEWKKILIMMLMKKI